MQGIFEQFKSGADVDMATPEYAEAIKHMTDCANICFKINTTAPLPEQIRPLEEELFGGNLDKTSYLMPPLQIDFARQMKIGKGVFVNHSLTCMAAGGITIDDGVMIGPNVRIVTDNHDFQNRMVLRCKPVHIGRNAWIGVGAIILPGVTIGENAVVAAGAVVTKDVAPNTCEVYSGGGHAEQRPGLHDSQAHEPPAGPACRCHLVAPAPCPHQHHLAGHHRYPAGLR